MKKLIKDNQFGKIIYCHDENDKHYLATVDTYSDVPSDILPLHVCNIVGNVLPLYGQVNIDAMGNVLEPVKH